MDHQKEYAVSANNVVMNVCQDLALELVIMNVQYAVCVVLNKETENS